MKECGINDKKVINRIIWSVNFKLAWGESGDKEQEVAY